MGLLTKRPEGQLNVHVRDSARTFASTLHNGKKTQISHAAEMETSDRLSNKD
jgi:hypothetical protein